MLRDDRAANNIRKKLYGSLRLPLRRGYSIRFRYAGEACYAQFNSRLLKKWFFVPT
jgi:hypothetical protein